MEYQLIMTDKPLPDWIKAIKEISPNDKSQNLIYFTNIQTLILKNG